MLKRDTITSKEAAFLEYVILSVLNSNDKNYFSDTSYDEIEYQARDGFYPYSDNHGGAELRGYVYSLYELEECSNCEEALEAVRAIEEREIEDTLSDLKLEHGDSFDARYSMGDLDDEILDRIRDDQESYEFSFQILFHGKIGRSFSFTVQTWVNWEYPYHRPKAGLEKSFKLEVIGTEKTIEKRLLAASKKLLAKI